MTTNQTIALAVSIAFVLLLVVQVVILFYVRSALSDAEAAEPVAAEPLPTRRAVTAGRERAQLAGSHQRTDLRRGGDRDEQPQERRPDDTHASRHGSYPLECATKSPVRRPSSRTSGPQRRCSQVLGPRAVEAVRPRTG